MLGEGIVVKDVTGTSRIDERVLEMDHHTVLLRKDVSIGVGEEGISNKTALNSSVMSVNIYILTTIVEMGAIMLLVGIEVGQILAITIIKRKQPGNQTNQH